MPSEVLKLAGKKISFKLLNEVRISTETVLGIRLRDTVRCYINIHNSRQTHNRGLDLFYGEDEISHCPLCIDLSHNSSS